MKRVSVLLLVCCWVSSTAVGAQPNVLLICIDDLRPELHCYGVDYIHSPHIDRLASEGRAFHRHYVQAPTCGASRFAMLTGRYGGASNDALFTRSTTLAESPASVSPSLPAWFRQHGYTTVSVGKVSHHPGGRGGADWDDEAMPEMPNSWDRHLLNAGPWQHPRGWMHGLANGEIRKNSKEMALFQSSEGSDAIYPDGSNTDLAIEQLEQLAGAGADSPFFLAFGILRPHLPFGAPAQYYAPYAQADLPPISHPQKPEGKSTWHKSGEFFQYNNWGKNPIQDAEFALEVRRHYAACVSFADAQVGRILERLEALKLRDNTIVVLWGDHGWHLGEHAIWGKHALFEESLRSPLIVRYPGMTKPGVATDSIVESVDIFPTLVELAELPQPESLDGRSMVPILETPEEAGHSAVSYFRNAKTLRTESHRLIEHQDGFQELYDHRSSAGETLNVADQYPELVQQMSEELRERS
ncbi:sulfatase [Aureliella helgolandensis]|uniref:Arylsulfatase n=1 Tax=Aureliella helgolandensis TaxID=2527968 RepID=A0A518GA85_9BACT|nr:sulfatase [Aureliella helgolandensis]QDV25479.1 Arylsulfatase [Aureliella helgolandensis]